MPRLHETIMGNRLFNNLIPRLVTALEKIAESLDSSSRLEKLEIALNLPASGRVECQDGFSFMLTGRDTVTGLHRLTFTTEQDPDLEKYIYFSSNSSTEELVQYREVPALLIAGIIVKHGGLLDG